MITPKEYTTKEDMQRRVKVGAAMLDEHDPDWRDGVDTNELWMASCSACVLGQVFGEYARGREELNLNMEDSRDAGFNLWMDDHKDGVRPWDVLLGLWIEEIKSV